MNIEDVARDNPTAIYYEPIDIITGITKKQALFVAEKVRVPKLSQRLTILHNYYLIIFYTVGGAKDRPGMELTNQA